jgi:hypothetical protein
MKLKQVVLVGDGPEEGKRPLVEQLLAAREYRVFHLANVGKGSGSNAWMPAIFGDRVIFADLTHPEDANRSVLEFFGNQHDSEIRGFTTYAEECVPVTDELARLNGLSRITRGDPMLLRDKHLMRETLKASHIPQPQSVLCCNLNEVKQAVSAIGFPCVIKPVSLASSLGVRRIDEREIILLPEFFDSAQTADAEDNIRLQFDLSRNVLIEEYVSATREISVEGIVVGGVIQTVGVTEKHLGPEPHFQEIGHTTSAPLDSDAAVEIGLYLQRAASSLQLDFCAFHAEFRLPPQGPPVLIEIAGRLGGDLIHLLWHEAYDIPFPTSILDLAAGIPDVKLCRKQDRCSSIWFFDDIHACRRATEKVANALPKLSVKQTIYPSYSDLHIDRATLKDTGGHVRVHGELRSDVRAADKLICESLGYPFPQQGTY